MEATHDLITNLPKEILLHILSFLPLKEALRTIILSTSWRCFWTPKNVNLNTNEKFTQSIDEFLWSYNSPEKWKLSRKFSGKMEENMIILATKGVGKELHLDFHHEKQQRQSSNFNLKLEVTSQNPLTFASLKILSLRSVNNLAENLVPELFSNLGFLECLEIEKCVGLRILDLKGGGSLKKLTIVDCVDVCEVSISAPNLKSFLYQGVFSQIELRNACNLVDVMVDMREGLGQYGFDCEELLSLLEALKDVEILTLSGWLLEWLCSAGVVFRHLEYRFSKLKELWWIESSMDRPKRDSMAYFLDICPSLERLLINIDGGRKPVICPHFHQFWHEPYFLMDDAILKPTSLQAKHLKFVKLCGFKNQEDELLLLLDLLLNKALILKSMIVTSLDYHSWEVVKIPLSQLKVITMGRKPKHITKLSPSKDYFFGFVEECNSGSLFTP